MSSKKQTPVPTHRLFRKARYGTDRFILVGKHRLHYVEAGQGTPVILIPGSYSTHRAWNRLIPLLVDEYRLLAMDYLGVGDSDKPNRGFDYTVQEQTDLIAAMVRQMGLPRVHLIGRSYGGAIAFDFAARYPELVDKVVSIEGGIIRPEKMMIANSPAKTSARIPWYRLSIARKTPVSLEEAARTIKSPVLYLYSTQSDIREIMLNENIEFLKKYLPQAWVVAMERGIHDLALQQPAEIAGIILEFLRAGPAPVLSRPDK